MTVPPNHGPFDGLTFVIVGGLTYVNKFGSDVEFTDTATLPAVLRGVVAVIDIRLTLPTVAGFPPIVTVGAKGKLVPVIVIRVPPDTGPIFGFTFVFEIILLSFRYFKYHYIQNNDILYNFKLP
jgi:hypothetical protein